MNKLLKAIANKKCILSTRKNKIGLYENFGEKEIAELTDKFINSSDYSKEMNLQRSIINDFVNYCYNMEI